jgi:hypothetical protein
MDWVGWGIGVVGIAYAIWTDYRARTQRERLHAFLKGLKTGVVEKPDHGALLNAINDEMAVLIPPRKSSQPVG